MPYAPEDDRYAVRRRTPLNDDQPQHSEPAPPQQPQQPQASPGFQMPGVGMDQNPGQQPQHGSDPVSAWNSAPVAANNAAFDRTAFRDAWMSSGAQNPQQMQDWFNQNANGVARGVEIIDLGKGAFRMPTGEIIDGGLGFRAGGNMGGPQWTGAGGTQNGVPVDSGGGTPSTGFQAGGVGGSGGPQSGVSKQLYDLLLSRASQAATVDRNDPMVRATSDAYSANAKRSERDYLADLAEQSSPTANLRGEQRLAAERTGQATGAFEANAMVQQLTARRDEIAQALAQLGNQLTSDQALALQRELGYMNNAIQQASVANQGRSLDLQGRGLDQQWQTTLMNNDQFMKNLGLQAEDRKSYWDSVRSGLL